MLIKKSRLLIAISVLILSLALVTGALAAASRGTSNQPPPPPEGGTLPEGGGPWVVRAYYDNPLMVAALAQTKEPWEVNRDEGYVVVDVTAEEYLWLQWQGFRLEVDEARTKLMNQPRVRLLGQTEGIPGYPCYRTVEETYASAEQIMADYPNLASWIDIGDSWEKIQPDGLAWYDLMVLKLTNANIPGPKPKFFAMSAIHAREYATAELNTRFAEYLVENYGKDPDITWILDYSEVHLLLQSNPDGRNIAETGDLWRKNTDNDDGCSISSLWGTDLNRNFDFQWACCGGSSLYPCDDTYHGPSAGSEPETQAVQNYVTAEFPDQRPDDLVTPAQITATGVFLDIHSYSQLVLWPWGFAGTPAPNSTGLQTLGRKFAYFNNYWPEQAIGLYPTDGTTDDFAYGRLGLAGYVFEIGTDFFQDCSSFESTIYPDNLQALIYAAKISRTPYMTPAGPDSLSVLAAPVAVAPGDPVELTAQVNDTRYNNSNGTEPTQNIASAEYSIDVPPWSEDPAPVEYAMSAADGSFDKQIEDVTAVVDTSGLSTGRHMIYVRGQDKDGNWGAVSAAFLYVVDPDIAPRLEGYVRDYATNTPLAGTVTAGLLPAYSERVTGFYNTWMITGTFDVSAIAPGHTISTVNRVLFENNQTIRQNFTLMPTCPVFSDDVESGNQGWTAQAPWAITNEDYHSDNHSWTDSPSGQYQGNRNVSLTSPILDLSGKTGTALSFWHIYNTEPEYDFGYVEYSINGGSAWTQAAAYSGGQSDWTQVTIQLPALDGEPDARIRFRFTSDSNTVADGWHIDDFELFGSGSSCITSLAPTADFISSSPVLPGETARFTNMTEGSNPLTYSWDFGDGQGSSTESDPLYTYASNGTYLVTLTASNSEGSDSVTHTVVVEPCQPVTAVTLTLQTTGTLLIGQPVNFQVDIAPEGATKPYSYGMDFGDGTDPQPGFSYDDPLGLTYTYALPGDFQAEILVQSCDAAQITDTLQLSIIGQVRLPLVLMQQ